jgi:transcription-repair coupling factor (superfamily II helicase)
LTAIYGLRSFLTHAEMGLAPASESRGVVSSRAPIVQVTGASDSLIQLAVLGLVCQHPKNRRLIVVLPESKDVSQWSQFLDQAVAALNTKRETSSSARLRAAVLPYFSGWGADRYINPDLSRRQRVYAMDLLARTEVPSILITTLQALAQATISPGEFREATVELKLNQEVDQDELFSKLDDLGYRKVHSVEEEGTYAPRGAIIDIYPPNEDSPARLEFLGDTIVSMRHFDAKDQKSTGSMTSLIIRPTAEFTTPANKKREQNQDLYNCLIEQSVEASDRDGIMQSFGLGIRPSGFDMFAPLMRRNRRATAIDYIQPDDLLVFPRPRSSCHASYKDFLEEIDESWKRDIEAKRPSMEPGQHFTPLEKMSFENSSLIEFGNPFSDPAATNLRFEARMVLEGSPVFSKENPVELFDQWVDAIRSVLKKEEGSVAILAHHEEQLDRISNLLSHRGLAPQRRESLLRDILAGKTESGSIALGLGDIQSHVWLQDTNTLVLPEHALFGVKKRRPKPPSAKLQNYLSSFRDLKPGDLVVHVQHGIGRYTGMMTMNVAGLTNDFLVIEYSGNDKIYMPVDRLNLLQRYSSGGEGGRGTVDRLGGQVWEKKKSRIKSEIKDMAESLLKLQAARELAGAHRYNPPGDDYFKLEAEFPYEETEDQQKAIDDVFADIVGEKSMDRLICGDVGFGKTEVALRAAMRAVLEGDQVLVLVPTTVLCYQHFRTFSDRLSRHGVKVGQVNRFVDAKTTKANLDALSRGDLDILVGTHRLLSKDIKPKRLGLLVIDEEQRFGVVHKEKLKQLRANAHVLTLTATPIPRTLHMSMLGLRDISIIATPPQERLSVKTYICRFDESLIRDAILNEVARGGQVFFLHNRVEDIEEMRLFIKSLVPGIDVRTAHGQMKEHQLEEVIIDFMEQKFPVLICTTIIESGIDMPNVNTLIVNRAENFGLAQLYQIRGRVGRSSMQAYAYFLTAAEDTLTDEAKKRLEVLSAHQELGAGFQIASYDLEIRGAGNLLGGDQSGKISEIGLELYTDMLETAIAELRGQEVVEKIDTEIKLPVTALIPATYIEAENLRLPLYKSLFSAGTEEDLLRLKRETVDRFGPLPDDLARLFRVATLKRCLSQAKMTSLAVGGRNFYELKFGTLNEAQIDTILDAVRTHPDKYRLTPDGKLYLYAQTFAQPAPAQQDQMIAELVTLVDPLAEAISQRN